MDGGILGQTINPYYYKIFWSEREMHSSTVEGPALPDRFLVVLVVRVMRLDRVQTTE